MKANATLQAIYSVFLGLTVVAFFGIGMATFYPAPEQPESMDWEKYQPLYIQWNIYTSAALLVFAVLVLLIALFWVANVPVVANGLLLGGLFTLFLAVMLGMDSGVSVFRFTLIAVVLVLVVGVGWYRFVRKGAPAVAGAGTTGRTDTVAAAQPSLEPTARPCLERGTLPDDAPDQGLQELAARVALLEDRLDAAGKALHSPGK